MTTRTLSRPLFALLMTVTALSGAQALASQKLQDRADRAADVLASLATTPDHKIPAALLNRATCIAVIPSEKTAAWFVGATYGRGVASCRTATGWSAPSYVWVAGGSVGFQWLYKEADSVLLFFGKTAVARAGANQVLLGTDASIGAGPFGRELDADTDVDFRTEILSYSQARGVYAGISLDGLVYRSDRHANRDVYGNGKLGAADFSTQGAVEQLLTSSTVTIPESAYGVTDFMTTLQQVSDEAAKAASKQPVAAAPIAVQ